jgi:glutamyl-tRNA reductase
VVGAGKIGRLACQSLRDRGADLAIVNRTLARAESLAERVGARALPLDALGTAIAESDVVIASTASPRPIIDATMLRSAFAARSDDRPLTVIDIAVPRNVAADVATLPGVTVLDIDDLRRRVRSHLEERCREIPRAESIIDEVLRERERCDETAPGVIGDLRRRALEQDSPRNGTSP